MVLRRIRWFVVSLFLMGLLLLLSSQPNHAATYTGSLIIDGETRLALLLSPPIATSGDELSLTVRLANGSQPASPQIQIELPAGVRLDGDQLPAGVVADLQNGRIQYTPILPAGETTEFTLPLRVETVDVDQPEQELRAILIQNEAKQTAVTPIWLGLPPQIGSISVPPQAAVGQLVQLDAELAGSGPFTLSWKLGDGRRIDVASPSILYPVAGPYDIQVEVSNPLTAVNGQKQIFIVPYPAAGFMADDETVTVNQPVQFVNESGGQPPLIYRWDFGDGTNSTELNPIHQYALAGIYRVQLAVSNRLKTSEAFSIVQVGARPAAEMEVTESVTEEEQFIGDASGDATVTEFVWDMGDGRFQNGQHVTHQYQQTGNYYVRLTAVNAYGSTEIGRWIYAESPAHGAVYLPIIMQAGEATAVSADPFSLDLPDVPLDAPFTLAPLPLSDELSEAEQLLIYINEARAQFGRPPLPYVLELGMAAQQHVNDMAMYGYTAHIGADGSYPAERLIWHNYTAGYAGEATAWGFQYAYEAVEFWINSPPHRRILLNAQATDIGVGFVTDYDAPNVWYWTAEFGNRNGAADAPLLRAQPIPVETELIDETAVPIHPMVTTPLTYYWNWPRPLSGGQSFTLSLLGAEGATVLATVTEPRFDLLYGVEISATHLIPDEYMWQVALLDGDGRQVAASQPLPITFAADPSLITPTPVPLTTIPILPATSPSPTPTTIPIVITSTPPPPPIQPIITTTPVMNNDG